MLFINPKIPKQTDIFNLLLVETHNRCNRACSFCKFSQVRQDPSTVTMGWDIVEKMVDDLAKIGYKNRISWVGINEPLLDKRLAEIIAYVKSRLPEVFQSTITNGDALNAARYEVLKKAGLDSLAISVYDDSAWEKSNALQLQFPEIKVWDQRKYSDLEWAIKHSKDFTNRAGGVSVPISEPDMTDVPCKKPYTGMSVLPNGDVPLCSDDMYGDVILGNVMRQSLQEIWFGEGFERYRSRLLYGRRGLKLCNVCTSKGGAHAVRFP